MRNKNPKQNKTPLFRSALRRWHTILGLASAVFLFILAVTGIYLNHEETWFRPSKQSLEKTDLNAVLLFENQVLLGTSRGVYLQQDPKRLVAAVRDVVALSSFDGELWVLTRSGILIRGTLTDTRWQRVTLPEGSGEAYAMDVDAGQVLVSTTDGLYASKDLGQNWDILLEKERSFGDFMRQLHSGWIAEPWLVYAHDLSAVILIFLLASGVIVFLRLVNRPKKR